MADEVQQDMKVEQSDTNNTEEQPTDEQMTEENQGNGVEAEEELDDDTEDERKLFVGGINMTSTVADVKGYFGKFGKVVNCTLKTDHSTQRSRGFGFVIFASVDSVQKVIDQKEHELGGKKLDPKKATPRAKKIFVGKLDQSVTEDEVKEYFSKFGPVEKMEFPFDKNKDARRAFCFVEFELMSSFKKCLEETNHKIKDKEVDVKKATLPQGNQRGGMMGRRGHPGQGGRGGRGGYHQGQYGGGFGSYYPGYYDASEYYGHGGYYNDAAYYNNGYYPGWQGASYNQGYGGYGGYGYDWGYEHSGGNQANYGKSQKRGGGQGYHPYNR